jgi:hypothetical protein
MKLDLPYAPADSATFWAVFLGAFLAAAAGFAAGQVEAYFRRRERERTAALLFGEVFSSLRTMLEMAKEIRGIGDPYGPFTMRMLRAARGEIDVYDRNRETLYDLRAGALRVGIHNLMMRLTLSLDAVIDGADDIEATRRRAADDEITPTQREQASNTLAQLEERREQSFAFTLRTSDTIAPVMTNLSRIAKHDFQASVVAARAAD